VKVLRAIRKKEAGIGSSKISVRLFAEDRQASIALGRTLARGRDGRHCKIVRVRRAETIGTVADLPNRRDALAKMEERLRDVNQGTQRPESGTTFAGFVGTQWKVLALPNFKASTRHGYNMVLTVHVLPDGGPEVPRHRAHRDQFRHIHSSLMSDLRVPVKIAQEQLDTPASRRLSTSTHTSSMRHTGARSKRWKIGSS
jgi:hypothetical protein